VLTDHQASFGDLASETLFLRDVRRDLPFVLDARSRVLAELGQTDRAPKPGCIEQAPLDAGLVAFELAAAAIIPRRRDAWSAQDVRAEPTCPCDGCARSGGRLVHLGDQTSFQSSNVYGTGANAYEQVLNAFGAAERLLLACGLEFRDVVRVWIQLRDIDRDYAALNAARRDFFHSRGIVRLPASTGVQGGAYPGIHDCSVTVAALRSPRPLDAVPMSTPTLNEAPSYGADFSRGLRVTDVNKVALHVSGTASIDETGESVHLEDFTAQVDRMLRNIATLLEGQGATFADLVSGVTYLRNPADAPRLRAIYRDRGLDGFPCAVVEAPLCRPELLCEAEVLGLLPLKSPGR